MYVITHGYAGSFTFDNHTDTGAWNLAFAGLGGRFTHMAAAQARTHIGVKRNKSGLHNNSAVRAVGHLSIDNFKVCGDWRLA